MNMLRLWLVLYLFVLSTLSTRVYKSSHQTLDSFISDTADTLEFLSAHKWKERSRFPSKLYNLTDTVTIWDRQLIEGRGSCRALQVPSLSTSPTQGVLYHDLSNEGDAADRVLWRMG